MSDRPAILDRREVAQLNWNQVLGHVFSDLVNRQSLSKVRQSISKLTLPYLTLPWSQIKVAFYYT